MVQVIRQMKDIKGECEESQRERSVKLELIDNLILLLQTEAVQLLEVNPFEFSESNRKKTKVFLAQNIVIPVIDIFNVQKSNIQFELDLGYKMN